MNYFYHNSTHRKHPDTFPINRDKLGEMMEEKDLGHIVKVSPDTFTMSEIIPVIGIMLCVLSLRSSS